MNWLILTLACIILWGVTDILYKATFYKDDPLSYYKSFVWVGLVMALAGFVMSNWSDTLLESIKMVKNDVIHLVPLCLIYAFGWFFGLVGTKHLGASVVSTIENIDGALVAIVIYFYYLFTGYVNPSYRIGSIVVIATVLIIVGVVLLGRQEHVLKKQEMNLSEDKKKHSLGAFALFFPIIYTLIDAFTLAEISGVNLNGGMVEQGANASIPAIDFFIFECAGFALVAVFIWLYMLVVKKYAYNPFQEEELIRCGAATGETTGTMAFLFASSINPILTTPIASLYCLVTIVLARIFLKERLTKKQYLSLALVVAGIVLLGVSEIINA